MTEKQILDSQKTSSLEDPAFKQKFSIVEVTTTPVLLAKKKVYDQEHCKEVTWDLDLVWCTTNVSPGPVSVVPRIS